MKCCLVTGGAGFIGSHLTEALIEQGYPVRVLDNLSTGHRRNLAHLAGRVEFVEGDVGDEKLLDQVAAGVEVIFHLAALVSVPASLKEPLRAETTNALGTLKLLAAAKAAGVRRLVLSSTSAVYGNEPTLPKTETMPPDPQSPYAISKLAAEQYCQLYHQLYGQETVILRYFNVYGPRQDPSSSYSGVISIFIDDLARGLRPVIYGDGEQTRDFVYVKDVVRANLLAAWCPSAAGQIFNVGTGQPVSINHLFETARRHFGLALKPCYKPARPGDIRHSYASANRAKGRLGWAARVSLEAGLRQLTTECRVLVG